MEPRRKDKSKSQEGSFGPLSHALLEHRLYIGASRRPAGPQFESRRKESLHLGSNRGPNRGLLGQFRTLFWLLHNYHNCQTSKPPLTSKFRMKKERRRKREEEREKKKEKRKRKEREEKERRKRKKKRERQEKKERETEEIKMLKVMKVILRRIPQFGRQEKSQKDASTSLLFLNFLPLTNNAKRNFFLVGSARARHFWCLKQNKQFLARARAQSRKGFKFGHWMSETTKRKRKKERKKERMNE